MASRFSLILQQGATGISYLLINFAALHDITILSPYTCICTCFVFVGDHCLLGVSSNSSVTLNPEISKQSAN